MITQCTKHLFIIPLTDLHGDEDGRVLCARCGVIKPMESDSSKENDSVMETRDAAIRI